ncbi:MAG: DUF192 domain-containing protein [Acidimicrobiia bacterium]|nr:DUF192 domain-containing protein [Acidimicrobiia bacterium]
MAIKVYNRTRNAILAERAAVANTSQLRRTGLLKHESLPEGEGLWIVPCEAIHTFGMKFAIDVLFLSKKRVVKKQRRDMAKRRISICLTASSVLELPAGTLEKTGTEKGDQLEFENL